MNWKDWARAAGIRALKTAGQSLAAAVIATGVASAWEINWVVILGIVCLSVVLSIGTSLAGLPEVKKTQIVGDHLAGAKGKATMNKKTKEREGQL